MSSRSTLLLAEHYLSLRARRPMDWFRGVGIDPSGREWVGWRLKRVAGMVWKFDNQDFFFSPSDIRQPDDFLLLNRCHP